MKNKVLNSLEIFFTKEEEIDSVVVFGSIVKNDCKFDEVSDIDLYIETTRKDIKAYLTSLFEPKIDIVTPEDLKDRIHLKWEIQNFHKIIKGNPFSKWDNVSLKNFISEMNLRIPLILKSIRKPNVAIEEFPTKNDPFMGYLVPHTRNTYSLAYIERLISTYAFFKLQEKVYTPYLFLKSQLKKDYIKNCQEDKMYHFIERWDAFLKLGRVINVKDKKVLFSLIDLSKSVIEIERELFSFYKNI